MLDVLFPRNCISCGVRDPLAMRYLCWDCLADTPKIESPFCAICGDPVAGDIQHDYVCYACSRQAPAFDLARSAVRYDGGIGEALRALKYENALWLAPDLADLLAACVRAEYPQQQFDYVTAVPLYPARHRSRGYNQSAELAGELARRLHLPFRRTALRRIRSTLSQTGLTASQRADNVSRAFKTGLFSRPAGQKILLVDDVMTTGATVNACAKALKKGGAMAVFVVTVARG